MLYHVRLTKACSYHEEDVILDYIVPSYDDAVKDFNALKGIIKKAYSDDSYIAHEDETECENGGCKYYYLHNEGWSKGAYVDIWPEIVCTDNRFDEVDLIESLTTII